MVSGREDGLIAGIVVSGFGLASVYTAPLTTWLIKTYGFQLSLLILGVAFLVVVVGLAQLLRVPHKVLQFTQKLGPGEIYAKPKIAKNYGPVEMLATPQFYLIWFMYACGAGAGLMIIGKLAAIADKQVGISLGFVLVAVLAIGNGGGRVLAGIISDKFGRKRSMFFFFVFQAFMIFLISRAGQDNVWETSWSCA